MIIVWQTEKRAVPTACGELRRLRRGNKKVDTCGFYPLDSRFPLEYHGELFRTETIQERQRIFFLP